MARMTEGLLERANRRAQRRFHRMAVERAYADPMSPASRLYVQAERLIDAILGEAAWQHSRDEWDVLQSTDPEAPDYFAAITESELRLLDGNR